jgi:hypothetical protein
MEAQQFKRFRGVRIVPIVRPEAAGYIVPDLQHTVTIDDEKVLTAPYRFGTTFSLLGLGQTEPLLETGMLDRTDSISYKAMLESVYLKVGEQYVKAAVNEPLRPGRVSTHRWIGLADHKLSVDLNSYARDVEGKTLSLFDPFTAAGIHIALKTSLSGGVNLELADACFYASLIDEGTFHFPDAPSFADDKICKKIQDDLMNIILADVRVVGYDLDIDRVNALRAPQYVSQENLQAAAADTLVSRYRTSPEYHPV